MRQEVFELHALLKAAEVAPPYILVGHSYGGLLVRLYTAEYPKELQKEKDDQKADLARLSRNAKLVRDPSRGHHLHVDNPELVARSIEESIQVALQGTRLSP